MRTVTAVLALAGFLVLSGCTSVMFLNPVSGEQEAVSDAGLAGTWRSRDGDDFCIVRPMEGRQYGVTYVSKDEPAIRFEGRLFRAGGVQLLELIRKDEPAFTLPGRFLVKLRREGDELRFAFLDSDWLREQVAQANLSAYLAGSKLVILEPAAKLRPWIERVAADEKAYGETEVFRRE